VRVSACKKLLAPLKKSKLQPTGRVCAPWLGPLVRVRLRRKFATRTLEILRGYPHSTASHGIPGPMNLFGGKLVDVAGEFSHRSGWRENALDSATPVVGEINISCRLLSGCQPVCGFCKNVALTRNARRTPPVLQPFLATRGPPFRRIPPRWPLPRLQSPQGFQNKIETNEPVPFVNL